MTQTDQTSKVSKERTAIDQGWYCVIEPKPDCLSETTLQLRAEDDRVLTRKLHGAKGRRVLSGPSGLPWAALLRVAYSCGEALPNNLEVGKIFHSFIRYMQRIDRA